ncbi:MAG: class I tRNA ligase family protein, partial [Candidatus Uhrbacteria bacterium]
EFQARIHGDLLGTVGNFWQRTFSLAAKNHDLIAAYGTDAMHAPDAPSEALRDRARLVFDEAGEAIERSEFRRALQITLALAQDANRYLQDRAPWTRMKDPTQQQAGAQTITTACLIGDALRRLIAPFTPHIADALNTYLGTDDLAWTMPETAPLPSTLPTPLVSRIDNTLIAEELEKLTAHA